MRDEKIVNLIKKKSFNLTSPRFFLKYFPDRYCCQEKIIPFYPTKYQGYERLLGGPELQLLLREKFATTWQGGQVGDQYTDIFKKEFSSSEQTTI